MCLSFFAQSPTIRLRVPDIVGPGTAREFAYENEQVCVGWRGTISALRLRPLFGCHIECANSVADGIASIVVPPQIGTNLAHAVCEFQIPSYVPRRPNRVWPLVSPGSGLESSRGLIEKEDGAVAMACRFLRRMASSSSLRPCLPNMLKRSP
ncbi:MAG: hypothetical protein AB3N20_18125 [Rhizobiaceae bacterium]